MLVVRPIKKMETEPWLLKKHYAKRLPNIMYAFGLFDDMELIGVITYGMPPSPTLCVGVCGENYKDFVLELNRLCLANNERNQASFLISRSLRMLPQSIVVSFADTGQGHIGYIYQATNFLYTGLSAKRTDVFCEDGNHPRHADGDTSVRQERSRKHRYIYFTGSKKQKKEMLSNLKYEVKPYPKGETKRYDAGGEVATQKLLF